MSGFEYLGLGLKIWINEFVSGFRSHDLYLWIWVSVLEPRVWDSQFGSIGLVLMICISGFGSQDLLIWIWGSGFGCLGLGLWICLVGFWCQD